MATARSPAARAGAAPALGASWRSYWSAGAISVLGDGAFTAALPIAATGLTRDPRLISGLSVASTLPWLIFSLQAGALADRSDGRRLLVRAQGAQLLAVALVGLYVPWPFGGVWPLYGLAFAAGISGVLARNAGQALLPAIVPPELLVTANSRLFTAESIAQGFLGPAAGAALFALGPVLPFWADAATFALSMLLVARITARPAAPGRQPGRTIRSDVREALRWLRQHRLLRTAAALVAVANFGNFLAMSTLVLFIGPQRYGLVLSTTALGGIAGAFASRPLLARFGGRRIVPVIAIAAPLSMISVAVVGPSVLAVGALTAVSSACGTIWTVASVAQRQRLVPAGLQGRIAGAVLMLAWGAQPFGALAGGFVAASFGLRAPWIAGGALRLCGALLAVRTLARWQD